jgi:hypothetical protein
MIARAFIAISLALLTASCSTARAPPWASTPQYQIDRGDRSLSGPYTPDREDQGYTR